MPAVQSSSTHFVLNNGASIPSVGLGTWKSAPGEIHDAVTAAIEAGYRHIDCASAYCNEKEIGAALKSCFSAELVKREDLWITSKLWNTHHAPEDVPEALEQTLRDLQLVYLDLYLIHWPLAIKKGVERACPLEEDFAPLNLEATWKAMEKLLASGKVRAIGVSNFTSKKLEALLAHVQIVPAVVQVECHPIWQQVKLKKYCAAKGIHVSGYCPLGAPGSSFATVSVISHPIIKEIADKLGKSTGKIALRWGIQSGNSVLPKSTNPERLKANLDVFDWSIPEEDMQKISQIEQVRFLTNEEICNPKASPYKSLEELWDGEL